MVKVEILGLAEGLPRVAPGAGDDPAAARAVLTALFPGRIGGDLPRADLLTASYPEYGRVYAGVFGATTVVCGQDLRELTDLVAAVAATGGGRTAVRLQVNSAAESAALEILGPAGDTAREVMLVAEQGVIVDEGDQLAFERPFWSGERDPDGAFAVVNGAEMPFDVIDFGQEALRTLFGFVVDGDRRPGDLDARAVLLHGFVITADADDPADLAQARSTGSGARAVRRRVARRGRFRWGAGREFDAGCSRLRARPPRRRPVSRPARGWILVGPPVGSALRLTRRARVTVGLAS